MSGYLNGYGTEESYGYNRYEETRSPVNDDDSGSRARRAGNYGGRFETPSPMSSELDGMQSNLSLRRRGPESGTGGYGHFASGRRDTDRHGSSQSRDRNARASELSKIHGGGPGGRQIDDVLSHINEQWHIMTEEECVPVQVALQLMDYSSLGRANDYQDFQRTSKYLQKAMKTIVNEHHQGFNSSIGTFHSIQASIQLSQNRVRTLKDAIVEARSNLMTEKPELKALGSSSQQYDGMLTILGQVEQLQTIPEALDARIADKHFLPAVDLLQDALKILRKSEMENLGALTDLRIYFSTQESSVIDILIEELHDHLYLKSPYCQARWKQQIRGEDGQPAWVTASGNASLQSLYCFLDDLDTSVTMDDDVSKNPEVDNFGYIHMLLEALNKLGHLDTAVDRIDERLPVELYAIVERTNQEVRLRHLNNNGELPASQVIPLTISHGYITTSAVILDDFLQSLYAKLLAISEGHRAAHEVILGIVKRDQPQSTQDLSRGFKEMWKLFQSEIRSILHDYLATDGGQTIRIGLQPAQKSSIFQKGGRERSKIFKLSKVNVKSDGMAQDQIDLDAILEASVPGLVSKNQRRSGIPLGNASKPEGSSSHGHKLLTRPSVYNIGSLLPPTLSFLGRLKEVVPLGADIALSTLTSFLDDFLVNVFHPQLEDTVAELCSQCFTDLEAFQTDAQWPKYSDRPLFRSTINFVSLIKSFCLLLDSIPPDLTSTQLILAQIEAYFKWCQEWYGSLVRQMPSPNTSEVSFKPAASMAASDDIREVHTKLLAAENGDDVAGLTDTEIRLLLDRINANPVEAADIISDRRSVSNLCVLHNSMDFLANELNKMQKTSLPPSKQRNGSGSKVSVRHMAASHLHSRNSNKSFHLSMSEESMVSFKANVASIQNLAAKAISTLHIDIRLGVAHMLARAMTAQYILSYPAQDPDASILALNADLVSSLDTVSTELDAKGRKFVTRSLAAFMDHYIISNIGSIRHGMNDHGCGFMQLNILVLSQNLKSINIICHDPDVELSRSGQYYDLFLEGADSIVARAKDRGGDGLEAFSLEELNALLELWYKESIESPQREVQVKSQRELSEKLLVLSECLWNR